MADHKLKRIACRARTPLPGRDSDRTTRLPDELLEEQVYRLTLLTGVIAGLWSLGLFVDFVLAPMVWGVTDVSRQGITVELIGLVSSAFMFGYVRFSGDTPQRKTDAGPGVPGVERDGRRGAEHLGRTAARRAGHAPVVDRRRHSRVCRDRAGVAAEDAVGGAHRRVDGPAGVLARVPDGRPGGVTAARGDPGAAEFLVRRHRVAAGARPAPPRHTAARGAGAGQLPAGAPARAGRHGRGVGGAASPARPQRRHQAGAARGAWRAQRGRVARDAAPFRARGAGHRVAELAAHHRRVRLRRDRRGHVLLRDGAAGRARPRDTGAGVRPRAGGADSVSAPAGGAFAGRRSRARHGPPRHQAGEHLCLPHGARVPIS